MRNISKILLIVVVLAIISAGGLCAEEKDIYKVELKNDDTVLVFDLDDCIKYTLIHNPDLLIRKEQLEQAEAKLQGSFAQVMPRAGFAGHYNKYDNHPYITFKSDYDYTFNASQLIFAWGRAISDIKAANFGRKAAADGVSVTRQQVRFRVEEAFYNVLFARELVRISQETLDLAMEQLKVAQARYKAGETSNYDVLREEVNVSNLKPHFIKAVNFALTSKNVLKYILGFDITRELELRGEFEEIMDDVDVKKSIELGLTNRPELSEIKNLEQQKQHQIYSTWVEYLPKMTFDMSNNNAQKQPLSINRGPWEDYWVATVTVSVPIFDGFLIMSRAEEARAQLKQIRTSKDKITQDVKLQIINAILDMKAAKELVASQAKNVERASEGYNIMRQRYAVGKATQVDLLDAQVALSQAKVNYVQAVFDELVSRARYKEAIGDYSK